MRKVCVFCFSLAVALSLSACGSNTEGTATDQEWLDQYHEREAQVEEISPRLEAALYGVYDSDSIDISVSNTSGVINAFVEVFSNEADRSDFGAIVSALATRFLELPEEYDDYSFGDISIFYYITSHLGRKIGDDPTITYTLGVDEDTGRLMEPDGILPMQLITPEEVYYYLSGISPDTRSIPDPSFEQEALVPDNSFNPLPSEVFSTTAEENGLGDMAFYAEGEVVSRSSVSDYDTIQVATEAGDLYISAVLVDLPEISEGEAVTVYFVYTGWSDSLGGACGAYVYSE